MHTTASTVVGASAAPIWVDCDAGSDDALGMEHFVCIAPAAAQRSLIVPCVTTKVTTGMLLAARANIFGVSAVRGNTVRKHQNEATQPARFCNLRD